MKSIFSWFFLLVSGLFFAQNEHLSGFDMVSLTYKPNKNWMFYAEGQVRSIADFSYFDYYEIKGGIGYNINSKNQPFVGIGRYATYTNHAISQEELRLWLQYNYSFKIENLKIDNRFRAEQRYFHNALTDVNSKDNRYRYRIAATLPINNTTIKDKTFFANAFDEIFFGPKEPNFKRNRVYAGLGYQFDKNVGTALGYLWQREFTLSGNKNLHFLYFAINFTIDKSAKEVHHHNLPVAD